MNTLLLVEDEKIIRQGIRIMIERSGVEIKEIIECNNGLSALEILKTRPIDVMFTDIRMPKMDGITVLKKLRREGNTLPVLLLTARDRMMNLIMLLI